MDGSQYFIFSTIKVREKSFMQRDIVIGRFSCPRSFP